MKQVIQRKGRFTVEDVPAPTVPPGFVLVRTAASLLSAGTERAVAQAAQMSLVSKALARPELVRQAFERVAQDGLLATIEAVRGQLDEPVAIGYSAAGTVIGYDEPGRATFTPGDRVACAGAGFANHAEILCVPRHLCVPVPAGVTIDDAAFGTVGAIALHGVRLAQLEVGATVAVIGLGLLGQLAAQIVSASGCRVLGVDLASDRVALARDLGVDAATTPEEAPDLAAALTGGIGVDAVLITADTPSSDTVALAGAIARDRATVVAVGSVGLNLPRATYYRKELKFLVSRSYGPGRYDPAYELEGHDYPVGYVRWTEHRNIGAFLDLVARGRVRVAPLITHRFPVISAPSAYDVITGKSRERFLGVLLTYPNAADPTPVVRTAQLGATRERASARGRIGVLGAGGFAKSVLLPAFKAADAQLIGIASRQGLSAKACAERFGFDYCATDERRILTDPDIDAVVIATRHREHAAQVVAAAAAGKDVFVEKPLCINESELSDIERAFSQPDAPRLMVGFNRRFAPLAVRLRAFFADTGQPLVAHYRVNAGRVPPDHWVHDPAEGGRFVGEAGHFIDCLGWLVNARPVTVTASSQVQAGSVMDENIVVTITYESGSVATLSYVVTGDRGLGKERIEVHGAGRSAVLDDFRQLHLYRGGRSSTERHRLRQDKGHRTECLAFVRAIVRGEPSPIPLHDLITTTRLTLMAVESARSQATISVP